MSELYGANIANSLFEASPIVTFKEKAITGNTMANGYVQVQIIKSREDEIIVLKEEIEYLRKQNRGLLKNVGNRFSNS
ncbi:hypothetical protein [Arachidicoccus soli]|uniref:Uncharacterized protein n=1 Tax=Arachidicoccus soli TaxID=2341117 RepID=A0A386HN35_9BACT|nr:hypothetical protein [Arachidicoccus soli]AYD47318.1 hypothetical protein D6B99_06655 [Arachidicoccus soli]